MAALFKGVVHVYGPPGSGKTTFSLFQEPDPNKIIFLDGDAGKGKYIAEQMGLKDYYNLTELSKDKTDLEYHQSVLELLESLPDMSDEKGAKNKELLVWDNATLFMVGAHSFIRTHRNKFRNVWDGTGDIIGGKEWISTRKHHLPTIYDLLRKKAKLVIIITHEKPENIEGKKTGLMLPDADDSLRTGAGMVIRLGRNTRDSSDQAPVGLLIKRPPFFYDKEKREPINILPERVSPCTRETLAEYFENPVGRNAELQPHEIPDDFEYHLIKGTLNDEQRKRWEFTKAMALIKVEETMSEDILAAIAANAETPDIALPNKVVEDLKDRYPDLTQAKVKEILEQAKES